MAEQTDSKVPEIRFKGFEGKWEEEPLGSVYGKIRNAFVGTATPYYADKGHFYLQSNNVKNGEINRNTEVFINDEFHQKQKDNWLQTNDLVMVQSGHVGHTAVIPEELNDTAAHALIIISRPTRDVCSQYLNYCFQGRRAKRGLTEITTGNTIKHILASEIKQFEAFFPDHSEQTQIGAYFKELDRMLGLYQRKHDKLVTLKQAMLQKMFPQDGATTPEIRFKGFEGDWVVNSLDQLTNRYDNLRIPISSSNRTPGNTPYYGANGIQDYVEGYTHDGEFILVAEDGANDLKNYPVQYVNGKVWVNNHAHVLQAQKGVADNQFLKHAFSQLNVEEFLVGGGRSKLNAETMMKMELCAPKNITEQRKIGTYFRKLDELISQHATQLNKLKQIKSACLEKMFV